jgi:hypothetical protein
MEKTDIEPYLQKIIYENQKYIFNSELERDSQAILYLYSLEND